MMIETRAIVVVLAVIGLLLGLILSALHVIPVWAILPVAIATPPVAFAAIMLLGAILWIRGGSH